MKTILKFFLASALALLAPGAALAQSYEAEELRFSQAELDSMLAPVALYPDSLLSQLLIAATHAVRRDSAAPETVAPDPGARGSAR